MGDHERRKAEIGLGLAAAGWEEQQVSNLAICMLAIGKSGDVEQDERELERPPFRCRLRGWIASSARIAASRGRGNCEIHEPECISRNLVAGQDLNAVEDTLACRLHVSDESLRGLAPPHR